VKQAHDRDAPSAARQAARHELLSRYEYAARRYLEDMLGHAPGSSEVVDECFQGFSVKVLTGGFKGADRQRGRFRSYLRRTLDNLVRDYYRKLQHQPGHLDVDPPAPDEESAIDEQWRQACRDGHIAHALEELRQYNAELHAVLRLKMANPDCTAQELVLHFQDRHDQPRSAEWLGGRLFRARECLCQFLRYAIGQSLLDPTDDQVDEELADLGLLELCPRSRRTGG
jgi:RNA polymerase sigma factor (sigma-70 family)